MSVAAGAGQRQGLAVCGDDVVHVLFCADQCYIRHAAASAVSVAEATATPSLCIHLISCDMDAVSEAGFRESLAPYAHVEIAVHRVDPRRLANVFVDKHLSKEAYLRFLAPDVLPESVNRVVYLDCDVIVLDDVATLFHWDLAGRAVAAAPDLRWNDPGDDARFRALGIALDRPYVNSGVLVMDLARWRRDGLPRKLFDFVERHGALLLRHDQDALNAVLANDIQLLERRWNLQVMLLSRWARRALASDWSAASEARRNPAVLHFSTADKPWKFRVWTRKRALYFRYRDRTPWRHARPDGLSALQRAEYDLARRLLRVGLDVYMISGAFRRLGDMLHRRVRQAFPRRRTRHSSSLDM